MLEIKTKTRVIEGHQPESIPAEVIHSSEPLILKGLLASWPLVQLSRGPVKDVMEYLKSFYNGRETLVCKLAPEKKGRLFYNDNLTKLDYTSFKGRIDETLDSILRETHADDPTGYYIASNIIDTHLPGLRAENDIVLPRVKHPQADEPTVSIWIGNKTIATCHYDALDNIACCVTGKRRFTLFPPDQVENLYPGPLDPTPGGQVISLVDFSNPDFKQFPNFRKALTVAQVAELEPGDALFLPSMWWHHVEGLSPFNILINYWWNDAPSYMTSGMNALYMAMLGIRDKPEHEREAWKHLFNYYIFDGPEKAQAKMPPEAKGFLDALDNMTARKLRALLIHKLNR